MSTLIFKKFKIIFKIIIIFAYILYYFQTVQAIEIIDTFHIITRLRKNHTLITKEL